MLLVRSLASKMTDQFLLTYLLNDLYKRTKYIYETKIHKLTFLSEKAMINRREKGFNYYFVKFFHGPYSFELDSDLNDFAESEVIKVEPSNRGSKVIPTNRCIRILSDFGSLARRNRVFLRSISAINRQYGEMGLERLLKLVYQMKNPLYKYGKSAPTIANLSLRTPLIKPLSPRMADVGFSITSEEIATLEIYFDKEAFNSLTQASESAKSEPFLNFDEVL